MKRFFAVILSVIIIAAAIYCFHSCTKDTPSPEKDVTPQKEDNEVVIPEPEKELEKREDPVTYTGVGIYHGKADSTSVEITISGPEDILTSCKLSPELAKKFSSLNLEEESIISFEYQLVNGQYIITKIIK